MLRFLSPLALFTNKAVSPLFISRLLSSVGVGFGQLALTWGVISLGYGASELSIVLACNSAPAILIIFGGIAGDRFRRHHVLVAAELLASATWLSLGACFLSKKAPFLLVCALATMAGVAIAMFLPTIRGIVADLLTGKARADGNALISQTQSIGLLVGLTSSGLVISTVGPGWAALARGLFCTASAFLLSRLRTSRWHGGEGLLRDLRHGWKEFAGHRWVWLMTLQYTGVIMATVCYTDIAGPLYMNEGHGGARAWGIVTGAEALGALFGAAIGARWKTPRPVFAAAALPAVGALPMVLLWTEVPWQALAAVTLIPGACQAVYYVLWTTALQNVFTPDVLVRVNSWNIVASYVLMPITVLTAGPSVKALGPQTATLGAGLLILTVTTSALLVLRFTGSTLLTSVSVRDETLNALPTSAPPRL